MPNDTRINTNGALKALPYLTAFALACLFLVKNAGFIKYLFQPGTLTHIWAGTLISNTIITPALLILFLASIWYLGDRTLNLLEANEAVGEYRTVFSLVLGTGIMNLILILLGTACIFDPAMVIIVFTLLAIAALHQSSKEIKDKKITSAVPQKLQYPEQAVLILLYYVITCGYVSALSPPSSWDSLSYHLPIAKKYLEAARILPIPYLAQHQCSIGMEMLSAAALAFNNDRLAQLLPFASFVVTLRIIYIFVKKRVTRLAGSIAAALFAVLPVSLYLMGKVTNDFHLVMFTTAAFVSLVEFKKSGQKQLFAIALLITGFAVNAKLTGLIVAALVMVLVMYLLLKKVINIKSIVWPIAVFTLIASVTLARNFIFTGNPVFPVFYQQLGGKGMSKENFEKQRLNNIDTTSLKPDIRNFLMLPYQLIKNSDKFQNQPRYFVMLFIILMLIRLVTMKKPEEDELYLIYFAGGFMVIWFFAGSHIWRYMLPVLPAAVMLVTLWNSKIQGKVLKAVAGAAIIINFATVAGLSVNNNLFAFFALPSKVSPDLNPRTNYLLNTLDNYDMCRYINLNTNGHSKILLFREFRSYYIEREFVLGDPLMQNMIRYEEFKDLNDLALELSKQGITHILVNFNFYQPSRYYYDMHIMDLMQKFAAEKCIVKYSSNGVELYEIKC